MEHVLAGIALLVLAEVVEGDGDACVEEGELTHAVREDIVFVGSRREDGGVGPELLARAAQVGRAHHVHARLGVALGILLAVDFAVAKDLRHHAGGECVHAAHADAVETAGHLVGAFVELTAGVEHGHDHFEGRTVFFRVHVHGNTSAVVLHYDGVVLTDSYFDVGTIASQGFVDGVVHGFVDQVVKSLFADVTDVHSGALSHGFQAFEHLDVTGTVATRAVLLDIFHYVVLFSAFRVCKSRHFL